MHPASLFSLPSAQNFALRAPGANIVSIHQSAARRTLAMPIADDVRAFGLVSLLSLIGLVLILSTGAA